MTTPAPAGRPVMLITGASRGMGRGIAEHFLARGYVVCGCARGPGTITTPGYEHETLDVGDAEKVRAWVRGVFRTHGRLDAAICNAGLAPAALLMTMTGPDVLDPVLRVNVAGTYNVCREAGRIMMSRGSGRIVTVSSMAVGLHEEGTSAYAASKSAVVEMTKILAKELAPSGVTCNVLAPSMYQTEAVAALGESVQARALDKLTIKRPVSLDEICNVVSFFLAPDSGCITGQVVHMGLVT
jgi:3-oxoacyl-[acyl-carrier protein] reductase